MRNSVVVGFGLTLTALLVSAAVSARNTLLLINNDRLVAHTHGVVLGLEEVLSAMKDAETGQRGFLLTGREAFLEPYLAAVGRVHDLLDRLGELTADNPVQQVALRGLRDEIDAQLAGLDEAVRTRRRQPIWPAGEAELERLRQRKRGMDQIRASVAAMQAAEQSLLAVRTRESEASAAVTFAALAGTTVLSLGTLALAYYLARRERALQQRAAEQVRQQREWLEVTLLGIADGVIATDGQGRVLILNPVAQVLTGWSQEKAVGRPVGEVFRIVNEHTRLPVESPVDRVIREGVVVGLANHTILIARDGTERPIDDSGGPIRTAGGEVAGAVLVFRDVSERRRTEAELTRRAEKLAEADRRKDEFLAMLAHELRNPLAPLRNALHVLQIKHPADAELGQLANMMGRQVAHLVRLVDDLLDVSRVVQGKIELRRTPVDLADAARRALEGVRPLAEARQHRLELRLPETPLRLDADPDRLEQVFSNLLNNACKYTPPGGAVTLEVGQEQRQAVVCVRDSGIGIRPEMLGRVFDMFQQADRVPGWASEGLGLGLTLVRQLVELHGGTVEVHSAGPGQGSEFVVRLPLAAEEAPGGEEGPGRLPDSTLRPPASLRILVVEDNVDVADTLALLLRLEGHEVQVAPDGPSALEAVTSFRPEMILLDIGLPPGMDGYEAARRLRAMPEGRSTLLVALTGYSQEEDRRRSRAAGFDAHLVKPVEPEVLRQLIRLRAPT